MKCKIASYFVVAILLTLLSIPAVVRAGSTVTVTFTPIANKSMMSVGDGSHTWASLRDGATATAGLEMSCVVNIQSETTTDEWTAFERPALKFDTSSLTGKTISSASLLLYGKSKTDTGSWGPDVNIYGLTSTSTTAILTADYGNTGMTAFSTAVAYGDFVTTGVNNFVLNTAGIANINTSGTTMFSIKNANFDVADTPPTWTSGDNIYFVFGSIYDTADKWPVLSVTYEIIEYTAFDPLLLITPSLLILGLIATIAILIYKARQTELSKDTPMLLTLIMVAMILLGLTMFIGGPILLEALNDLVYWSG